MKSTPFLTALRLAGERDLNLARPCLELGISIGELETLLNRGNLKALETCAAWIGIPLGTFITTLYPVD